MTKIFEGEPYVTPNREVFVRKNEGAVWGYNTKV